MRSRPSRWKSDAVVRIICRSPARLRDSAFPFIVQETGREPAKLEIEVQVLVKGPLFSSRGEITIMQRFERCLVGGSPAVGSHFSPRGQAAQASAF